jgi:hypothetical protein
MLPMEFLDLLLIRDNILMLSLIGSGSNVSVGSIGAARSICRTKRPPAPLAFPVTFVFFFFFGLSGLYLDFAIY